MIIYYMKVNYPNDRTERIRDHRASSPKFCCDVMAQTFEKFIGIRQKQDKIVAYLYSTLNNAQTQDTEIAFCPFCGDGIVFEQEKELEARPVARTHTPYEYYDKRGKLVWKGRWD